ncbi:MAG: hypothetical protein ACLPKB_01625 [Xanthobacteraceae bacterium]
MMRVLVEVEEIELKGDLGAIPSVEVTCTRCGHKTQVYGRGEASVRRGCVMLREQCPRGEKNLYLVGGITAAE